MDPMSALLREAERRMVDEIGISSEEAALTVGTLGNLVIRWLTEHLGDETAAYARGRADAAREALAEIGGAQSKAKAYHYRAALNKAAAIVRNVAATTAADRGDAWDCQAYGPEGTTVGALCFFSPELGSRVCCTQGECQARLDVERRRVFGRIQDMAAAGDPVGEYLADEFTTPGQILGGGHDQADGPDETR